jgi:hypothetical protein
MSRNSEDDTAKQKAVMLNAIEACYGNITKAAKMAKTNARTHYRWQKEDLAYANQAENLKDISYRARKENLEDLAFSLAEKGNVSVLNKLLGIYLKNLPEEMKALSFCNNVPLRAKIKWVNTPVDPTRTDHLIPKEERDRMLGRGV